MLDFNIRTKKIENDSPVESIAKAMAEHGLEPGEIIADGTLHRFDVSKPDDKAGWYVIHCYGDVPAGAFGNFRTDLKETWCSISGLVPALHVSRNYLISRPYTRTCQKKKR